MTGRTDQALASLRIETAHSFPMKRCIPDQALASLRIETMLSPAHIPADTDKALASLRFEVSVLKFTQSRPDVGVNFPKI